MKCVRIIGLILLFPIISWADTAAPSIEILTTQVEVLQKKIIQLKQEMAELKNKQKFVAETSSTQNTHISVITSPYLGQAPAFDGSDLISSMSVMNLDVSLMVQRSTMESLAAQQKMTMDTPLVILSGTVQPIFVDQQSQYQASMGALQLYNTVFNSAMVINPWVEGFFSLSTGTNAYVAEPDGGPQIDSAFVNIGNLDKTPFYFTAGQVYVPFGRYRTNMVTSPMVLKMGQTREPAIVMGYSSGTNNGMLGTLFTYSTNTTLGQTSAGGGSLLYQFGNNTINGNIGSSITSNIADSSDFQDTGSANGQFAGFGMSDATEAIHQMPGYDFNGMLNMGDYRLSAEFLSAVRPFPTSALSYNGNGAQPMSGNVELARSFDCYHKPATFALGYGWTEQALALAMSQQRYSAIVSISWWRNTIESLEFRHDINYGAMDYATGIGSTVNTVGAGNAGTNTITASLSIFF